MSFGGSDRPGRVIEAENRSSPGRFSGGHAGARASREGYCSGRHRHAAISNDARCASEVLLTGAVTVSGTGETSSARPGASAVFGPQAQVDPEERVA